MSVSRLLLAALLAVAAPAAAQEPATPPRYQMPNSEVWRIPAKALGREYEYVVNLPLGYASNPERRYPVLMYTDAPQSIALINGMHRRLRASERGLQDAIIVGLGYAVGDSGEYSRRRDYTPTAHGDIDAVSDMPGRQVAYGEAEGYRQHLKNELFPELERRYRIDPARRTYLGHSYGGLFGMHILLNDPSMFQQYVLISPSLWYDRRLMIARERGYAMRHKDMPAKVFFMIGGEETVPDPDTEPHSASRMAMVEDMAEMVRNLESRNYPGLSVKQQVFPGEDHGSVYVPAVRAGLEWALPGSGKSEHKPCLDAAGKPIANCRMPWAPRD
ncbi:alpha/beta hydrolase [Sandaracinobacteroides hominis]|uniref:alpha/beta hydrolase n=1 Tax=Sandaracinobacteroides hominis TaxID=2780086 RepID=UPI0018F4FE9E|nr:alpha/beta hydrolase-fold protein [Sandaracinobacteroides hominis]